MEKKNPIFKKNYENYLRQLDGVDLSMCESILGVAVEEEKGIAKVPFFRTYYNDADEHFPAQASILYERRAASFLDAECRVMIDWYLLEYLKRVEP